MARRSTGNSSGWGVVLAYASVCASTQVLWLTYAAITTESARRYGVSEGAVGWLAEILLGLPAARRLGRAIPAHRP